MIHACNDCHQVNTDTPQEMSHPFVTVHRARDHDLLELPLGPPLRPDDAAVCGPILTLREHELLRGLLGSDCYGWSKA